MWEPTRRIRNARRKLDGLSPVALLVDDLKRNPAVDKFNSPGRARSRPAARAAMTRIAHFSVLIRSQNLPDRPVWEPTRRIRNARQKLDGLSPVALLVDDLKQNPALDKSSSLAALEAILRRGCP